MTEEQFADYENDDIAGAGRCPYCRKPGWIAGDEEWCEHYAGTRDIFAGSQPINVLASCENFEEIIEVLRKLGDATEAERTSVFSQLSKAARDFFEKAMGSDPEVFWIGLVRCRKLSLDVSESLFDTTYQSFFVKDMEGERARLLRRAKKAMSALVKADRTKTFFE